MAIKDTEIVNKVNESVGKVMWHNHQSDKNNSVWSHACAERD